MIGKETPMPRHTQTLESTQFIPEMVDDLLRGDGAAARDVRRRLRWPFGKFAKTKSGIIF